MFKDKVYWIIGASSGIGAELAKALSAQGAKVIISARSNDKLVLLQAEIGAETYSLDVTNFAEIRAAASKIQSQFGRIDSVIFMAGVYTPSNFANMQIDEANKIFDINFKGALNSVLAVLPILKAQQFGQIVLCASVAGYRGLPNSQPYGATKAAVINLAESLKLELAADNIDVKVINPGFVKTQLTDKNKFAMPAIITPEQAAQEIVKGLKGKAFEIHFPKKFTYFAKLLRIMPNWLYLKLAKRLV